MRLGDGFGVEDLGVERVPAGSVTITKRDAVRLRDRDGAQRLARAFAIRPAPRGVRRFRSVEEADAHRQRWESGAIDGPEALEPGIDGA